MKASSAATVPGRNDSWVKYEVEPLLSRDGGSIHVDLETLPGHGKAVAHFQLSLGDARVLAAKLAVASDWLERKLADGDS